MISPNGQTQLMGLIGRDISYTLSPIIHNAALQFFKKNAVYLPLPMTQSHVESFIRTAWDLGVLGLNVTKPYKEAVAHLFPNSGLTSVNTLYRGNDWWIPASTDSEGLIRGLMRIGRSIDTFQHIVILGSGGAAQAIIEYLEKNWGKHHFLKMPKISVCCRDIQKGLKWKDRNPSFVSVYPLTPLDVKERLCEGDLETLLIQATSAPRHNDMMDEYIPCLNHLKGAFVDLIYDHPSHLYFAALAKDIPAQDGEPMLIEQARLSQDLWFGKSLEYDLIREALRKEKKHIKEKNHEQKS